MAAFRHAIDTGCDAAELDVQLSQDGAIVIHHDLHLNHQLCRWRDGAWITPDESHAIRELTLDELRRFEVGVPNPQTDYPSRFDRMMPVAGEVIPTLDEVITLASSASSRFQLVIEIKTRLADAADEPWRPLVEAVVESLHKMDFTHRAILCGFDWGAMIHAKSLMPDLKVWFTTHTLRNERYAGLMQRFHTEKRLKWPPMPTDHSFPADTAKHIRDLGGNGWFMQHEDCTGNRVQSIRAAGLQSAVWSVNLKDETEIRRVLATGVDAVCSDYP